MSREYKLGHTNILTDKRTFYFPKFLGNNNKNKPGYVIFTLLKNLCTDKNKIVM